MATPATSEILVSVKALLSERKRWTKGDYAKDKELCVVDPHSDKACNFCLLGGIIKVTGCEEGVVHDLRATQILGSVLVDEGHGDDVAWFNDAPKTRHADVMKALDAAIEIARNVEDLQRRINKGEL